MPPVAPTLLDSATPVPATPKRLPADITRHLAKVSRSFQEDVMRYVRASSALERLREDLEVLNQKNEAGETLCKYPPGVRPFKTSN
eukprot:8717836-Lingulodinium_polyedra.AAC.1